MGRMDDSEVRERGAGILSGSGVFEVIQYDRRRLPAECNILRGAHQAPPLCINISPRGIYVLQKALSIMPGIL